MFKYVSDMVVWQAASISTINLCIIRFVVNAIPIRYVNLCWLQALLLRLILNYAKSSEVNVLRAVGLSFALFLSENIRISTLMLGIHFGLVLGPCIKRNHCSWSAVMCVFRLITGWINEHLIKENVSSVFYCLVLDIMPQKVKILMKNVGSYLIQFCRQSACMWS